MQPLALSRCISQRSRGVWESRGRIASIPVGPILFSRYFNSANMPSSSGSGFDFQAGLAQHEIALGAHAEFGG